jgi:thiosulfate dehydrogenase [quinone] large subunit
MDAEKLTRLQMTAIALLRMLVGWHFLYEGLAKWLKPNWSASSFLLQARGPLAGWYHWIAGSPDVLAAVNFLNIWGLILIGLGLMLGCLTRAAGSAGLLLILLYYFCNPPFVGYFYSLPSEGNYLIVNKNLVEAAALLVLVVMQAGRYYGLDQIIHKLWQRSRAAAA